MGIKDVFDRIKGKSDDKDKPSPTNDEMSRRDTNEETVQVRVPTAKAAARDEGRESPTMIARPNAVPPPAVPPRPVPPTPTPKATVADEQVDATVVAGATPPPQLRNAGPNPRAPFSPSPAPSPVPSPVPSRSPSPGVQPSVTPVAQSPGRIPAAAPIAQTPAAPHVQAANASPSAAVSSADETVYQKPNVDNRLDFAALLVGIFGEAKNEIFRLPHGASTIGRADDCGVQLLDPKVSRKHAAVQCADGSVEITALNERNPLLVNDEPISGTRVLTDGDTIQFGNAGASVLRLRTVAGL